MNEIIFLVEDSTEGGYEARALGQSIFTEGESMEELKGNIREAVSCHYDEKTTPSVIHLQDVKDKKITL